VRRASEFLVIARFIIANRSVPDPHRFLALGTNTAPVAYVARTGHSRLITRSLHISNALDADLSRPGAQAVHSRLTLIDAGSRFLWEKRPREPGSRIQTADGKVVSVHYHELVPMLLNELQKQDERLQKQLQGNRRQAEQIRQLTARLEHQSNQVAQLKSMFEHAVAAQRAYPAAAAAFNSN
jgi:hypothetical protein